MCSFTWRGSHLSHLTTSLTFGMIYVDKYKNYNKILWHIKFMPPCTARIWDPTPNLNFSANFGTGNTFLTQHLLPDDQDRVCQRFKQNYPKNDHFLMPLHTAPELLSTCVQNMTKNGLGRTLWMCKKVLDHLSQKIFSGLVSETFHPNPLCTGASSRPREWDKEPKLSI